LFQKVGTVNFYIETESYWRKYNFKPGHLEDGVQHIIVRRHPGFNHRVAINPIFTVSLVRAFCRNQTLINSGASMKKLRILPGAAGVIALTAAIGFIDGERKIDTGNYSSDRITLVSSQTDVAAVGVASGNRLVVNPDNSAYLVEIKRGDAPSGILIDAVTGQVLLS
jgi:hypothetical protein